MAVGAAVSEEAERLPRASNHQRRGRRRRRQLHLHLHSAAAVVLCSCNATASKGRAGLRLRLRLRLFFNEMGHPAVHGPVWALHPHTRSLGGNVYTHPDPELHRSHPWPCRRVRVRRGGRNPRPSGLSPSPLPASSPPGTTSSACSPSSPSQPQPPQPAASSTAAPSPSASPTPMPMPMIHVNPALRMDGVYMASWSASRDSRNMA